MTPHDVVMLLALHLTPVPWFIYWVIYRAFFDGRIEPPQR